MMMRRSNSGFTLIEGAASILVMLILATFIVVGGLQYSQWADGQRASDALRSVEAARRMYLADNPGANVASLTQAMLLPYLPGNTWPTMPAVNGVVTTIGFTTANQPPSVQRSGVAYDPSGSTTDGVWDLGR